MTFRAPHAPANRKPLGLGGFEVAYVEPKKPSLLKAILRRATASVIVAAIFGIILLAAADAYVRVLAKDRTFDDLTQIEPGRAALVPGTSPWVRDGGPNIYFNGRIAAAAELFHSGRATFIIVSGDNEHKSYNEPREMRRALIAAGVPGDRIVFDFAGFRTLDSIVRAQKVFGQEQIVVVSQKFHNERAICLARHFGIDAIGYNATGPDKGLTWWRNWIRERLARVQLLLDLYVYDTEPRHLGPLEPVPGEISPGEPASEGVDSEAPEADPATPDAPEAPAAPSDPPAPPPPPPRPPPPPPPSPP